MRDREQIMKERAKAEKAWRAGYHGGNRFFSPPNEAELTAYLDREHPLEPEPKSATGPSRGCYTLIKHETATWVTLKATCTMVGLPIVDLPTVANLLCPVEDVVRAVIEAMDVKCNWTGNGPAAVSDVQAQVRDHLPAILSRLGESK